MPDELFGPLLSSAELNQISILALAHVGDSVYELLVRTRICRTASFSAYEMHSRTIEYVNASAQAKAAEKILPLLSQEEHAVFKRGRNAKVNSVPHNSSIAEYHLATGLEALFGGLFLQGKKERIAELFRVCMEE